MTAAFARSSLAQETHILVVTGVAGDDEYAQKFDKWAKTFIESAKSKEGVPEANITFLSGAGATKTAVEQAFHAIAARAKANDEVFILLIGHGSFDGRVAAFNLPGPDLTASDYAKLLSAFAAQRVVFVNTASASGAFLQPLAAPGRVVVTATKTGGERNETDFPEYFVAAFGDPAADRDRNGHVSINEAFEYAKTKVSEAYQKKGLMLTEHAALDDGAEGRVASTLFLSTGRSGDAIDVDMTSPTARALVEERDAIQKKVAALQLMKPSIDPAKYDSEMEKLLTDLALKTRALRELKK